MNSIFCQSLKMICAVHPGFKFRNATEQNFANRPGPSEPTLYLDLFGFEYYGFVLLASYINSAIDVLIQQEDLFSLFEIHFTSLPLLNSLHVFALQSQ